MDSEKFEKDMAVFSFRQHQDTLTYLSHLKTKGWTLRDAKAWVEEQIKNRTESISNMPTKVCPECQQQMQLLAVNFSSGTQTGDPKDKSVWLCRNCGEATYNKEDVQTIIRKLTLKGD